MRRMLVYAFVRPLALLYTTASTGGPPAGVTLSAADFRLATLTLRPLAVWMVAPVAIPTSSGPPTKLKVNFLQTQPHAGKGWQTMGPLFGQAEPYRASSPARHVQRSPRAQVLIATR